MIEWDAERIAAAAGARVVWAAEGARVVWTAEQTIGSAGLPKGAHEAGPGPRRVVIDSRETRPGDLFVGLPGERVDGGAYAERALRAGAWGVMVAPEHAQALAKARATDQGAVLAHPDPLAGLQSLARVWRGALGQDGAKVVAVTGSTGKTSTKDILAALLRGAPAPGGRRSGGGGTVASPQNLNTEIGLPLAVLAAPMGTRWLVLEMAMRGAGQIAELAAIAEPEVGVIVNVGPVHLEQLGSLEAIAAAKAELIAGMAPGTTVVIPAGEPLLAPHLRGDLRTVTFGEGGDVEFEGRPAGGSAMDGNAELEGHGAGGPATDGDAEAGGPARGNEVTIVDRAHGGERILLRPSFAQSHNLRNLLAAVAAARALGVTPAGRLEVEFSALRGERIALTDGIVLINDCYNANPMSMRAALDDLAERASGRRVAVLGDMLELGPEERRLHREIGVHAGARGVQLLVAVGPLAGEMGEELDGELYRVPDAAAAAELLPRLLRAGDVVLVKGSRGMGLERVAQALTGETGGGGASAVAGGSGSESRAPGALKLGGGS